MKGNNIYAVNNEKGLNCDLTESIYEYVTIQRVSLSKAIKHFELTLGVELRVFGTNKAGGANE